MLAWSYALNLKCIALIVYRKSFKTKSIHELDSVASLSKRFFYSKECAYFNNCTYIFCYSLSLSLYIMYLHTLVFMFFFVRFCICTFINMFVCVCFQVVCMCVFICVSACVSMYAQVCARLTCNWLINFHSDK